MAQAIQDARNAERKAERDVFKGFGALLETFGTSLSDWVQNLVETMGTQLNNVQSQLAATEKRCQQAEEDLLDGQKKAQREIEDMRKNMLAAETKLAEANNKVSDLCQKLATQHEAEEQRVHALQSQLQQERDKLSETAQGFTAAWTEYHENVAKHDKVQQDRMAELRAQVETLQNRDTKRKQSVMRMLQNFEDSLGAEDDFPSPKRHCTSKAQAPTEDLPESTPHTLKSS